MGVTQPRHRLATGTVMVIDCKNQGPEELNFRIVTLALDHGYVIPGTDVAAIMWDFQAGIRWAAGPALTYLDDLLEDDESIAIENNRLVVRQSVPEQAAN
jgi:hypothetical protein